MSLAKQRVSIDKDALLNRIGHFLRGKEGSDSRNVGSLDFEIEAKGLVKSGRDIILATCGDFPEKYIIAEFYRFGDDGSKRLKFRDSALEMQNGLKWDVVFRASTRTAVERFIEANPSIFENKEIVFLPLSGDEDPDESIHAKLHSQFISGILETRPDALRCLHCGELVSQDGSPFIEIDDEGSAVDAGLIHDRCRKPTDRVLGLMDSKLFRENPLLQNFDYGRWFAAIQHGQGLFHSVATKLDGLVPIAWKYDYSEDRGSWCVKINLEDGSAVYALERGKVVRFSHDEAVERATELCEEIQRAREARDPWCYVPETGLFSTYSGVLRVGDSRAAKVLWRDAEAVRHTRSIADTYSYCDNYYAPLAHLVEIESGRPIAFGGRVIFMLTEPLRFAEYFENWSRAGVNIGSYAVEVIHDDVSFDRFLSQAKRDGLSVLIDPILVCVPRR